jgi:hypothetical protein
MGMGTSVHPGRGLTGTGAGGACIASGTGSTRDDQLVVTLVVGKGGGSKGLGREQLGIRVGDPARRLFESPGVDIGAERAQKVARRALNCVVVDAAALGVAGHRLGQRKRGGARIFQGHDGFAPRARQFLPTAACSRAVRERAGLTHTFYGRPLEARI